MTQCKRCGKTNPAEIHTCTPGYHWIEKYNNALYTIINAFVEKYYTYDDESIADFDIIGINSNMHPGPVEIADYYRSISDIYTALLNDIPSDTLFERYDYSLNQYELKQPITNLYNYRRGPKVYTQEEKDKDNARIKEKYNELIEEINNKKYDELIKEINNSKRKQIMNDNKEVE